MRDDAWLADRMRLLWEMHFSDVPVGFPITTRFGSRARYRFGSIGARDGKTVITINQLFADPFVPTYVIDATLVHELAHYAHGFGSGLPRVYRHAHRGGVVDKELEKRGLSEIETKAAAWRAANWDAFHRLSCQDLVERRTAREETDSERWDRWLAEPDRRTEADLTHALLGLAPHFRLTATDLEPLKIEWLRATRRQEGFSYWYAREVCVRLHGLLADRRTPDYVIEFELAYWLARFRVGSRWPAIHAAVCHAGLEQTRLQAYEWRRRSWTAFRNRHHPLS